MGIFNPAAGSQTTKGQTVASGSVAAGATSDVTITWATPFPSDAYVVSPAVLAVDGSGANTVRVGPVVSKTASAVVVRVINADSLNARSGILHVVALQG